MHLPSGKLSSEMFAKLSLEGLKQTQNHISQMLDGLWEEKVKT